MWSINRLDRTNWVISGSHGVDQFLVSLFSNGPDRQVCVSVTGEEYYGDFVSIAQEIYTTTFWAEDIESTMYYFLTDYVDLDDLENPVEFVYKYGGQVKSRPVNIHPIQNTH